jgi:hypothetical protein
MVPASDLRIVEWWLSSRQKIIPKHCCKVFDLLMLLIFLDDLKGEEPVGIQ